MMLKKTLKIFFVLFVIAGLSTLIISRNHYIFFKWITGSARCVGKPLLAKIYTDGKENKSLKVFHVYKFWNGKPANNYILNTSLSDSFVELKYIIIHLNEKWVGRPVSTNKDDFDLISGYLFQSETASRSSDFKDDMKGYDFDPHLTFTEKQIWFNLPPGKSEFDSVRIELK